jgi:hypothetical protein
MIITYQSIGKNIVEEVFKNIMQRLRACQIIKVVGLEVMIGILQHQANVCLG